MALLGRRRVEHALLARSIRSTRRTSTRCRSRGSGTPAQYGEDEYYRTTPLYANGRLFTVATTRRKAFAIDPATGKTLWQWGLDEGIRWQKAPRQFAGRGLAYWTDGTNERVIVVTPGYHLASLDAKTGKADPKFGKDGVVDLMDGLGYPLVPLAVDDTGPLDHQRGRAGAQGEAGREVERRRRRPAPTARSASIRRTARSRNSSPAIVVGDVIVVGNSSIHGYYPITTAQHPGLHPRLRRPHRQAALEVQPRFRSPASSARTRGRTARRSARRASARIDAWATYSADPELGLVYIPVGMPLIDEYGGHRPGNNLFGNSVVAIDVKTGQAEVALPVRASRHLGLRHADGAEPSRRHGQRAARARSSRRRRSRVGSTCSIA